MARLKKIRIIVSLLFFIPVSFLFLDFREILPPDYFDYFLYLQFIPSFINSLDLITLSTAGFLFIIVLTFFFGRVYCSTICPLGTLQDIISFFHKKIKRKKRYHIQKDYRWTKYSFLTAAIILLLFGSLLGIYLLDPYSNFGRILSSIFRPALISLNNSAAFTLEKMDIYLLYPVEIKGLTFLTIIFPSLIFLIILIMTLMNGRLFCNTVCPVGTFLSLISKVSFLKISIKEEECISCRLCEQVCKSGCIDRFNKSLDFSRCVSCYNCLSACASGGIGFKTALPYRKSSFEKEEKIFVDKKRREFISKTFIWFLGFTGIAAAQLKIIPKKESTIPVYKKYPVSPPGSKSIDEFNERCTACNLCVAACPTQVLQPSYLEYGLLGILQPRMDYQTSFCNYDCIICTEVCPTDAIQLTNSGMKKLTQIGKSKFIKENCIVYTEETACGACSEHCPTKAVNMIPYKKITIPEVKDEYCIGCGACEYACPTKPYKAIYVEGNPVHQTAKKPEEKKLEEKINYQEDFPF